MNGNIIPIYPGFDQFYVLKGDGIIVMDSGVPKNGAAFARSLETIEISPQDVKLVILTHGHCDHIGSAGEIKSTNVLFT